jgi:hypothetical protein
MLANVSMSQNILVALRVVDLMMCYAGTDIHTGETSDVRNAQWYRIAGCVSLLNCTGYS